MAMTALREIISAAGKEHLPVDHQGKVMENARENAPSVNHDLAQFKMKSLIRCPWYIDAPLASREHE